MIKGDTRSLDYSPHTFLVAQRLFSKSHFAARQDTASYEKYAASASAPSARDHSSAGLLSMRKPGHLLDEHVYVMKDLN